jgi:tripartite-type tricarboxylate transporter receptor subunit TctC
MANEPSLLILLHLPAQGDQEPAGPPWEGASCRFGKSRISPLRTRETSILKRSILTAILVCFGLPCAALAQDDYPTRVVSMVVPFSPGGAADIIARPLAQGLERELRQPFIVLNKAGASGAIGTRFAASAPADGYTLLVMAGQISILPEVDALSGNKPSYSGDQLVGIALLTADPVVFVVGAQTPFQTLNDLLEAAKQQPGLIQYAMGGPYAGNHLPVAMLAQAAGVELSAIPYKGGAPSMVAVLGGEVAMTAQVPSVAYPHVMAGTVRAIAHSGVAPLKEFPGVPSLKSLGFDVEYYLWTGLFAPRGIPEPVLSTLRRAAGVVANGEELRKMAAASKTNLAYLDAEEFNKWWHADAARLIQTVRKIGKIE